MNAGDLGAGASNKHQSQSGDVQYYEIRLKGHLDNRWSEWFEAMTLTNAENGEVVLSGFLADQAALHGVLTKIRDLGLPLLFLSVVKDPFGGKEDQLPGAQFFEEGANQ